MCQRRVSRLANHLTGGRIGVLRGESVSRHLAELLLASGRGATALGITRAEYIRRAIEQFNRETEQAMRNKRLADASHRVRDESIRVNAEFDAIDDLRSDV